MKRAKSKLVRPKSAANIAKKQQKVSSKQGFSVAISHPEKVFWPEEGYTKLDLAQYYERVFSKLQPFVEDRILSLERCPDGMGGSCFFQKEKPKGMPAGTPTKRIRHAGGSADSTNYVVGGALATQLALVNFGCIAVHITGSRASSLRKPDWVCFDLDPQSGKFSDAADAALRVKDRLDKFNLESFAKTSGSRGMHVFVPIRSGPGIDEVLAFAQTVAGDLASSYPDQLTVEHSIAARGKRVYVDAFRNGFGQTVVAPYSVRRRPHAPVSMPLVWPEVKPSLDPADFNIGNFVSWSKRADPWSEFFRVRQDLTRAMRLSKNR